MPTECLVPHLFYSLRARPTFLEFESVKNLTIDVLSELHKNRSLANFESLWASEKCLSRWDKKNITINGASRPALFRRSANFTGFRNAMSRIWKTPNL